MNKLITIKNLSKTFNTANGEIEAIKDIDLDIYEGEIIGIVGSSGCGKSTLLNILADLEKPTTGKIISKNIEYSYMLQTDALLPWLSEIGRASCRERV